MNAGQLLIIGLGCIVLFFLIFCIVVIKRHWIDKKGFTSTSQFIGENILRNLHNKNIKKSVEQILYTKESWKQEDDEGENKDKN